MASRSVPHRERLCFDRDWRFALGHAADDTRDFDFRRDRSLVKSGEARGAAGVEFDDSKWRPVNLPHDWAIELPLDPAGDKELCEHGFVAIGRDHPQHSVGWYRKVFTLPAADEGRRISIHFDGVFRESIVWINGHRLGRHESGHTDFDYDLTDFLNYGGRNVIALRADASNWEGWWYEGAGIYRHVWLVKTAPLHVDSTFVTTTVRAGGARITARTAIRNDSDSMVRFRLLTQVLDPTGRRVASGESNDLFLAASTQMEVVQSLRITRPRLWSCEDPALYTMRSTLHDRSPARPRDEYLTTFGIRKIRWDPRRGLFLNGKRVKIKGTCNHQNHAGVGAAIPDALHEWRLRKLKEMGSNAFRCSHYPVAPVVLDLCDRLGLLVMAENRLASSAPQFLADFERMILRDRNHPSIILWSIGNEEHTIQWSEAGERIGRKLVRRAHQLDPTRCVTAAMHDRGLGVGFANVVDVHGWNYIGVGDIEAFHRDRPDQPIVGSEEGSTVTTRGEYHDDPERGYVNAYGTRTPKWGSPAEKWWRFFASRDWIAGGFVWTGFDYRGEPIPYKWPCTGSHFGLMDACGFPKDLYWYYRAWWGREPVLHLFPHWNWQGRQGQAIEVRCHTNLYRVELFLNGRSMGVREVQECLPVSWEVPYEPGRLEAVCRTAVGKAVRRVVETTGPAARLVLSTDRRRLNADGADVAVIEAFAQDAAGRPVPTAQDAVRFHVSGAGALLGTGNGDPSSHEPDKAASRRLFNGRAMLLVQAGAKVGNISIKATSEGLAPAELDLPVARARG